MNQIGPLLKTWRDRRRLSQLDLALEAGVSTRHLSFVETGRARPSEQMVMHLAEQLDVPLRERNRLLLAAGYAPVYAQRELDEPELAPVKDALDQLLGATSRSRPSSSTALEPRRRQPGDRDADRGRGAAAARAAGQRAPARPASGRDGEADHQLRRVARAPAPGPRRAGRASGDEGALRPHEELEGYPRRAGEPAAHSGLRPAANPRPAGQRAGLPQHPHDVRHGGRRHGSPSSRSSPSSPRTRTPAAIRAYDASR